ncbi:MAG: hypothetical protein K9I85_05435 [Saprospiraceae bacterium]|nr:hypothetical protein [Saprospiraceae bacterium]
MHRILSFILFLAFGSAQAQMETFMDTKGHISGFGGPYIGFGEMAGGLSVFRGMGGGLLVDGFFIGGILEVSVSKAPVEDGDYIAGMFSGGLWSGYSFLNQKKIHPYISLKSAISSLTIQEKADFENSFSDNALLVHPEAGVEFNITRVVRVVFALGYRQVLFANDLPFHIDQKDFGGPSGCLTLRMGGFGPRPTKEPPTSDVQSR